MELSYTIYRESSRKRLFLIASLAILIHGSLLALVLVWPARQPGETITTLETDVQLGDTVQELIVPETAPEDQPTPEPTPPPEPTPELEETPPPPEKEPEFVEPTPTPTPNQQAKPGSTPPPPGAKRGPNPQAGVVGGNANKADKTTGTPGGKVIGKGWKTPKPIYPAQARAMHLAGSGSVRISTDASGNVSSVEIVQGINPLLDSNTKSFARSNWKGPPNSSTVVPITYKLD